MTILRVTKKENCNNQPRIKELEYGTFVTDVPSGNECVYVKVKKKGRKAFDQNTHKKALALEWRSGYCILFNLTYGTLRQIPGDTPVTPLKPCLTVATLHRDDFHTVKKECYNG